LIPVFALGRAQELLLILDEYWQAHPELHTVPVFYASKLASKALRVYQTFVNMMNLHIRTLMDVANPFKLNFIKVRLGVVICVLSVCTAPLQACPPTSLSLPRSLTLPVPPHPSPGSEHAAHGLRHRRAVRRAGLAGVHAGTALVLLHPCVPAVSYCVHYQVAYHIH
jgi:hypothetical protein